MKIEDGVVGGMTNIRIISDHQLQNIYPRSVSFFFSEEPISSFSPIHIGVTVLDISAFKNVSESVKYFFRLTKCSIAHKENIIWPIHSFYGNIICFDHRLNVQMTNLKTTDQNPVIDFQMRVFRFRDDNSDNTKQEQEIQCEIYLEKEESTYTDNQCECYSADECDQLEPPETSSSTTLIVTSTAKPTMPSIELSVTISTTQSTTQSITESTTQTTTRSTTQSTIKSTTKSTIAPATIPSTTASAETSMQSSSSVLTSDSRVVVLTEPKSYISTEFVATSPDCEQVYQTGVEIWGLNCRTHHPTPLQFDRIFSIPGEYKVGDSDTPVVKSFKLPKYFKMEFDVWFDIEG